MSEGDGVAGIGERVRAARERAGLTREALAFHSGVSWSGIAQVETARRTNLRPATLAALAGPLRVTIDYLVRGRIQRQAMLDHCALLYEDEDQFLSSAAAFLAGGVEHLEAALVVTSAERINALRDRLGPRADGVVFGERREWYESPIEALAGYRAFLEKSLSSGAPWVRVVGDPVWRRGSDAELREWDCLESALSLVFAGEPISLLCAYDSGRLAGRVRDHALATHPHTLHEGVRRPSPAFGDPASHLLQASVRRKTRSRSAQRANRSRPG